MIGWAIGLYLAAVTPLSFAAELRWASGGLPSLRGRVTCWGIAFEKRLALERDASGKLYLADGRYPPPVPPPKPGIPLAVRRVFRVFRAVCRANLARSLARRSLTGGHITVDAVVSCGSAAGTSLVTGLLGMLNGWQSLFAVRVRPGFREGGAVRVDCRGKLRLGTLLVILLLALVSFLREGKKEERKWNIPSEI